MRKEKKAAATGFDVKQVEPEEEHNRTKVFRTHDRDWPFLFKGLQTAS